MTKDELIKWLKDWRHNLKNYGWSLRDEEAYEELCGLIEQGKPKVDEELFEKLSEIEHQRWADWQKYVHNKGTKNDDGSITLPSHLVIQWERQINTPYAELSEREKESDREQVKRYFHLIEQGKPSVTKEFVDKWANRLIFLPLGVTEHWTRAVPRQLIQMLAEAGVEVSE